MRVKSWVKKNGGLRLTLIVVCEQSFGLEILQPLHQVVEGNLLFRVTRYRFVNTPN